MIEKLLNVEGPFIGTLDKIGQLIALSVLWLLGCVPIVTIAGSTAALYYAAVKSVRRGQGSAVKEFFRSYRANLLRGIRITVVFAAALAVLALLGRSQQSVLQGAAFVGTVLLAALAVYIGPILSRFQIPAAAVWQLAFVMAMRHILITLLLIAGTAVFAALQLLVLPIPTVLVLPGAWCFAATYPMEKVLRRYMPPKEENDNAWYYEN